MSAKYQSVGTIVGYLDGNGLAETTTLDSFGRDAEIKRLLAKEDHPIEVFILD